MSEFSQWVNTQVEVLLVWDLDNNIFPSTSNLVKKCPFDCSEEQKKWAADRFDEAKAARADAFWNVT